VAGRSDDALKKAAGGGGKDPGASGRNLLYTPSHVTARTSTKKLPPTNSAVSFPQIRDDSDYHLTEMLDSTAL